jgi:hypothetical protein
VAAVEYSIQFLAPSGQTVVAAVLLALLRKRVKLLLKYLFSKQRLLEQVRTSVVPLVLH